LFAFQSGRLNARTENGNAKLASRFYELRWLPDFWARRAAIGQRSLRPGDLSATVIVVSDRSDNTGTAGENDYEMLALGGFGSGLAARFR
jgi:hypothetical protein